jgi:hypothetical protein
MSLIEYVDYIELHAIYSGVDANELNMEYCFEMGAISNERYERAKWEMNARRNDSFWLERGEVVR